MDHRDILMISTADWDSPIQTNKQYVAKELSKLGFRILYVESLGIRRIKIKKADFLRILKRLSKLIYPVINKEHNIYILSPITIPGASNKFTITINKFFLRLKLFIAMKYLKFKKEIIWTYNPMTLNYIRINKFQYKIYHAVDSIEFQPNMPKRNILKSEKALTKKVDKVFVTSLNLQKKLSKYNRNISFYGNVCDYKHFSSSRTIKKSEIPNDIKNIQKPIVGFIGSISEYKLDFKLISEVTKKMKDISFVFIGPTDDLIQKSKFNILKKQKNIYFLGYRSYNSLPNYCAHFDVGWLPIIKNKYTKYMFPIKFFEYLAAGLPVVSTYISSLERYSNIALLSEHNSESLLKNIKKALKNKDKNLKLRISTAKENTYALRTRKMLNEIDNSNYQI